MKLAWKSLIENFAQISQGQWVNNTQHIEYIHFAEYGNEATDGEFINHGTI